MPLQHVQPGSFVTLQYRLRGPDGTAIVDTFGAGPATLSLGTGELAPAMESRLLGLAEGACESFTLEAGEAFGARNPELLRWQLMLLEGVREIDTAESNWIMRLIRTLDRELAAQRGSAPGRPDPPVDRGPDPAA